MPENKSRFVLLCQQAFAVALVGAVAASAVGVTELEIVPPGEEGERTLVAAAPVEPTVRSVPLEEGGTGSSQSRTEAPAPGEISMTSDPEPVVGYATVGVTWDAERVPEEADVSVELRTFDDGAWSPWQEMHYDADHAPDPGSPEAPAADVRNGTDPVVVGDVEDVQVRATTTDGEPLDDVALAIVDPGKGTVREEAPAIDTSALASYTLTAGVPAKPKIFTRAQWGADERLRDKGSLGYGTIKTGFVHHTVNANDYSKAQVPQIIRGIYAYHTKSQGWSDVGYNFLVDRFGQIWEGRYGGVDKAVVGAHTYGYNSSSFAMSAIGNFEVAKPTSAMVTAYGSLMGWKLALHGVDAGATRIFVTDRYFHGVNGHRDAGSTACPGRYLYAELPAIRSRAAWLQKNAQGNSNPAPTPTPKPTPTPTPTPKPTPAPAKPSAFRLDLAGDAWPDLVVRDRSTKRLLVVPTGGQLAFDAKRTTTAALTKADAVVTPGDLDGDRLADVLVRDARSGATTVYAGTRAGGLGKVLSTTTRFKGADQMTGVGDFDGDGHNDVVVRTGLKRLALFPGRGDGTFGVAKILADRWVYRSVAGVDDFTGDERPDLVARTAGGLHLLPGKGTALGWARSIKRPGTSASWSGFDVVTGRGDLSGDGRPDLLVRSAGTGAVSVYLGDGRGGLVGLRGSFGAYRSLRGLTAVDQAKADKHPDLVGLDSAGRLVVAANTGRTTVGQPVDTGVMAGSIDLLVNAGDWNGDGRGDLITRSTSTGALQLRAGTKAGGFAAPRTLRQSPKGLTRLTAVGDMTGDGRPDLVGRMYGMDVVFPNVGGTSMGTTKAYRSQVPGTAEAGIGLWDGDTLPDSVVREGRTLKLWSSRTGKATKVATLGADYDWVLGLGDLDGDGRADLVGRTAGGLLHLLPGTGTGFGAPRLMGGGFGGYDLGS